MTVFFLPMREIQLTLYITCLGNKIGDEGARVLAESLKQNTTITELNLESMLREYDRLFLPMREIQLTCSITSR